MGTNRLDIRLSGSGYLGVRSLEGEQDSEDNKCGSGGCFEVYFFFEE